MLFRSGEIFRTQLIFYFSILFFLSIGSGCQPDSRHGTLLIESENSGSYEIYSVAGDASLQFVSDQVGHFNRPLSLSPGSYLILADCSHKHITIHPYEQVRFQTHTIEFVPPFSPSKEDLFVVQCNRYEKFQMKQRLNNQFVFNLISDTVDLLVSMLPLRVDFRSDALGQKSTEFSGRRQFRLSALQVAPWEGQEQFEPPPYFISLAEDLLAITQSQDFGKWQFLLPGAYTVEVNGTNQSVRLKANEAKVIQPAGFHIAVNEGADLSLYQQIRGSPFNIRVNSHHVFDVNTFYPVLPGQAQIRFDGAGRVHDLNFVERGVTRQKLNAVLIDSGCAPWEWECLGKTEVNLYLPGGHYPFLESLSDIPILYTDSSVQVGLEGSKGLRFQVPEKKGFVRLNIGRLQIIPRPVFKSGHVTELARIESAEASILGFSHDILPDRITSMPLIAGQYYLARYTNVQLENDRAVSKIPVRIHSAGSVTVELPYYLSENKSKFLGRMMRQKLTAHEKQQELQKRRSGVLKMF